MFECINNLFLFTASYMHIKGKGNSRGRWSGQRITAAETETETSRHSPNTMTENLWREVLWNKTGHPVSMRNHFKSSRGEAKPPLWETHSPAKGQAAPHHQSLTTVLVGTHRPPLQGDLICASSGQRRRLLLGQTLQESTETLHY